MSNKSNNATFNRPDGSRAIDAGYIIADLEERIQQLEGEEAWQKNERNGITLFKTDGMTVVLSTLKEGTAITDNVAPGILTVQVLTGSIEVVVNGDTKTVGKGEIVFVHREQAHTVKAREHTRVLVTLTGEQNAV